MSASGRRAALVAIPLLAVMLAAVAVGASPNLAAGQSHPNQQVAAAALSSILVVIAVAAAFFFGVLVWAILGDRRSRGAGGANPREGGGLRYTFAAAAVLALAVTAFGVFAKRGAKGVLARPPGSGGHALPQPKGPPLAFSWTAGGGTFGVIVLLAVLAILIPYLRRRSHRTGLIPDWAELAEPEHPSIFDSAGQLASELDAIRIAEPSEEPDPRRAVMVAWHAMVDAFARAVRPRKDHEAPQEYVRAVLVGRGVQPAAASHLTDLFEVAQWSLRPVGEPMRAEAIEALEVVRSSLRPVS